MKRVAIEVITDGQQQTEELGRLLGLVLRAGDVALMDGPLGAGKTCLVRGMVQGLGLEPRQVSSPTFVIVNRYEQARAVAPAHEATPLCHVDAYRLGGPEDLDSLGWDEVMDGSSVVAVEWAERLRGAWAKEDRWDEGACRVRIEVLSEERRRVRVELPEGWMQRRGSEGLRRAVAGDRCRVCGKKVEASAAEYPFCSERCRGADLGGWLTGRYVVPGGTAREED